MTTKKKEALLKEMATVVDKYKAVEKEEAKDKAKEEPFTKRDMDNMLNQLRGGGPQPTVTVAPGQTGDPSIIITEQLQQQPPTEKQIVAHQIWKDQKSLSIVCLIAVILPMLAVLTTMAAGEMVALIISFAAMIYPLFLFVKSMQVQAMLQMKYGFKPLFQFQPRRPMQPNMMKQKPQQPKDQEVML